MSFHDCGTYEQYPKSAFGRPENCGGCNGSFRKEFLDGKGTDFCTFPQQNGAFLQPFKQPFVSVGS
jgi:hypothetical protein